MMSNSILSSMTTTDLKRETLKLIQALPPDAEWSDLMQQIYVRQKIEAGLEDSAAGRVVTSVQIRKALKMG